MNDNKKVISNQKHLTLTDRTYIEQELCQRSPYSSIARVLHKDSTTIAKEVKQHQKIAPFTAKNVIEKIQLHFVLISYRLLAMQSVNPLLSAIIAKTRKVAR